MRSGITRQVRCFVGLASGCALLLGCGPAAAPAPHEQILAVPQTENWVFTELDRPVQVIRTESNVPHIYASTRRDLAFVQGFVMARDRYFMMDLARRLGLGTVSELLGDAALDVDQESRASGMTFLAHQIAEALTPELEEHVDGFAAGINAYIDRVKTDEVAAPSELLLAQGLLGASNPTELMHPFDRLSVAAMVAVVLYQTSYETGDVGRAATAAAMDTLFAGDAFESLRRAGAIDDLWKRIEPIKPYSSAAGFGLETSESNWKHANSSSGSKRGPAIPASMLKRLSQRLQKQQQRLGRDKDAGYGSNAWAVAASHSADGSALLAGDGHLSLAVPSILYQLGLDTSVFGRGNTHQLGLIIAGFPIMPIGTNGRVAWSQTQLMGDVTDWYAEELQLDAAGLPASSKFDGRWRTLVRHDESYVIADVPILGSVGRTEEWPRFETFDGRWIADVEGREASADEQLAAGESLINLGGSYVVPSDLNDDGVITAVSFDYGGFDAGALLTSTDALGHSQDVYAFREATRGLVAYSQNFAAADADGNILYSSYQAVPCRSYLEREADGAWSEGSDPTRLLDGTRYGGFRIPVKDGVVDESLGASDPYACVVPFDQMPQALNPPAGFVATANNDPGNLSTDGSLSNDAWYIGGPWDTGFRADTIARGLEDVISNGTADIASMATLQGNVQSPLGMLFSSFLLSAIDYAQKLDSAPSDASDQRLANLYAAEKSAIDEVALRLTAWGEAGYQARSGVATFYDAPSSQDGEDAVATMLFNAWCSRVIRAVFDDEKLPGVWQPSASNGQVRGLYRLLSGRGANNPLALSSWNEETEESVFFDVLGTDEVESSEELIVQALVDALLFLRQEPSEPGIGGFGNNDMSTWLWGLRHYVRFESLLGDFLNDNPEYASLTEQFAINSGALPIAESIPSGDPRRDLQWFPRDGDQFNVDAANPGFSGERFSYGSGSVMRMVVSLNGDEVRGQNIIPGGQSALTDSPYFKDQVEYWLSNDTLPMRFSVSDVVAGATGRENYQPH